MMHAMVNIWEADERAFIGWLELVHALPGRLRCQLLNSVYFYFLNVREEVKMERLQKELEANEPGGEVMQEIDDDMEDLMSMSVGEIRQLGFREGFQEGFQIGLAKAQVEVARRMAQDIAERFIAKGWSSKEMQLYMNLLSGDINHLPEKSGTGITSN